MAIFDISILGLHIAPSWYGATYAFWFIICYFFIKKTFIFKKSDDLDSLLTYVFFWVVLGWRIWYICLYNPVYFFENPTEIITIWKWWMSFHGGFMWTILAVILFCKKYKYIFWELIDIIAIIVPIALGLWRIGNWINKELPGYSGYKGIFPMKINEINHFPSPLLEMLLEGIILFIVMILFYYLKKDRKWWFLSGIFLIWYSIARLISELYRLPDNHIGYIWWSNFITLWMIYTTPMILLWVYLVFRKKD